MQIRDNNLIENALKAMQEASERLRQEADNLKDERYRSKRLICLSLCLCLIIGLIIIIKSFV